MQSKKCIIKKLHQQMELFFDTLHNESQLLRAVGMLHLRF